MHWPPFSLDFCLLQFWLYQQHLYSAPDWIFPHHMTFKYFHTVHHNSYLRTTLSQIHRNKLTDPWKTVISPCKQWRTHGRMGREIKAIASYQNACSRSYYFFHQWNIVKHYTMEISPNLSNLKPASFYMTVTGAYFYSDTCHLPKRLTYLLVFSIAFWAL